MKTGNIAFNFFMHFFCLLSVERLEFFNFSLHFYEIVVADGSIGGLLLYLFALNFAFLMHSS